MSPFARTAWCVLLLPALAAHAGQPGFAPPAKLVAEDARDDAGGVLYLSWPQSASESDAWDYVGGAAGAGHNASVSWGRYRVVPGDRSTCHCGAWARSGPR